MKNIYRRLIIFTSIFYFLLNINIVSAEEFCEHKIQETQVLVGVFDQIFCLDPEEGLCELYFTPDKGQNHVYKPLYENYNKDGPNPYYIIGELNDFQAPRGSRILITLSTEQVFYIEDCRVLDLVKAIEIVDKTTSQKSTDNDILVTGNLQNVLAEASQTQEDRIGINIKGLQLGMNEYDFLKKAGEYYHLFIKNSKHLAALDIDVSKLPKNINIYLMLTKDQAYAIKDLPNERFCQNLSEFQYSLAIVNQGKISSYLISGADFERLFTISNSDKIFLDTFSKAYKINFEFDPQNDKYNIYRYTSKDTSWRIIVSVINTNNTVVSLSVERKVAIN
jgi:hypothetical protein